MKESAQILIIDDLLSMRVFIKNSLKSLGFSHFEEAPDGQKAWELIRPKALGGSPYDLVICDWEMPNMSGIELLAAMKADDWCKKIPFLFISSDIDEAYKTKVVQLGALGYLVRPFQPDALKEFIDKV